MKKAAILILLFAAVSGCRAVSGRNAPVEPSVEEPKNPIARLAKIARKETATVGDMIFLVSRNYENQKLSQVDWRHHFVDSGWICPKHTFDTPLSKRIAGRLYSARYDLDGNLFLALFGPSGYYGQRELETLGYMAKGYHNEVLSGSELLNLQSSLTQHEVSSLPAE